MCGRHVLLWRRAASLRETLVALANSWRIGTAGHERPVVDAITELPILIGASQPLCAPLPIVLHVTQRILHAFVGVCAMRFVLYS